LKPIKIGSLPCTVDEYIQQNYQTFTVMPERTSTMLQIVMGLFRQQYYTETRQEKQS
jgi:hypothetical protein